MREVEVKYEVVDVDALMRVLAGRGVEFGPAFVQDDQAYAPQRWSYDQSKIGVPFLRLRTVAGAHSFTMKRPRENSLSCEEHETTVADRDAMHAAVLAMGWRPTVRIVKTRRVGWWEGTQVCLDVVEGAGTFVELERLVPDGVDGDQVQQELAAAVESLGVAMTRTRQTYDSIIRDRTPQPA